MTINPNYPSAARSSDHKNEAEVQVTWKRVVKVWWSLMWRAVLFGGIAGAVSGFIIGVIMGVVGSSPEKVAVVATWAGFLIGIPVGIWVVSIILRKSWSDFRIALVSVPRQ